MIVLVAADAVEVQKMVPLIGELKGPVYLRISRAEVPTIYGQDHEVKIGKGVVLREGSDVSLIGTGVMVSRCLEAAENLKEHRINARVINIHTLKPLDDKLILTAAKETGAVVTAEEHNIIGGLGEAVASCLAEAYPIPLKRVGIRDTFTETGSYFELLDKYGMGVSDIVRAASELVRRKG